MTGSRRFGFAIGMAFAMGVCTANAAPLYEFRLFEVPGVDTTQGQALNDAGRAVGFQQAGIEAPRAAYFFPEYAVFEGDGPSLASSVNNADQVAGQFNGRAALFQNGTWSYLADGGSANAINDAGQVVGVDQTGFAFLHEGGTTVSIPGLAGATASEAFGINKAGQIVGYGTVGGAWRAFLYADGLAVDLGTLAGGNESVALDINNQGQAAGWSEKAGLPGSNAALFENGTVVDLGVTGVARAINDAGQVVGTAIDGIAATGWNAFLFEGGLVHDLNDLLVADLPDDWVLAEAFDINERGQIVGYAFEPHSMRSAAFLLSPIDASEIPEPSVVLLLAVGCLAAARVRAVRRVGARP